MKTIKSLVDKAATAISKNKFVAAAIVSLFVTVGVVNSEDAGTWTNIVTALTTVVSAVL